MDYTRPNHIPTTEELARHQRQEARVLIVFAVVMVAVTIGAALVFGSHIA